MTNLDVYLLVFSVRGSGTTLLTLRLAATLKYISESEGVRI